MTGTTGTRQLVLCGLGGQGVVFLSRVIAGAGVLDGNEVLTAETHGMAQRGGAVEAHLKIGAFASSLVRPGSADAAIALDASRIPAARAFLGEGGPCFAAATGADNGEAQCVDAAEEASAMRYARGRNLVLLGFAVARRPDLLPTRESLLTSLDRLARPADRDLGRRAFERGLALATR